MNDNLPGFIVFSDGECGTTLTLCEASAAASIAEGHRQAALSLANFRFKLVMANPRRPVAY
jgi:hypothetical protein